MDKCTNNKYQSKVKVLVRVRPFLADEARASCVTIRDKSVMELANPKFPTEVTKYTFDACYGSEATQEEIYNNEIQPVLSNVFEGLNTTIFAYGMTGAGKTHTMQGNAERPGIIPRVAEHVLKMIKDREAAEARLATGQYTSSYSLSVSYLEIYNEKVFDLLKPRDQDLPIREDANKNIIIQNLEQLPVTTFDQFRQTYIMGCKNRTTAETKLNSTSSRSHAIIILRVSYTEQAAPYRTFHSKIHLIDLAGSEDNRRTNNTGIRMLESSNINTSLFVLGKVVDALNQNSLRVPYRDSKLTRMLQDSLGGKSYGILIANIAAGSHHFFETSNTLNFASKSRQVVNNPVVNAVERPPAVDIRQQLEIFRKLKRGIEENKENSSSAANAQPQGAKQQKKVAVLDTPGIEARIEQKVNQKLKEMTKKELLSPFIRSKKLLDEETMARLEKLEQRLNGQEAERALEGLADEDDAADIAPGPMATALTPYTKTKTTKELILKAKNLENAGNFVEALSVYRKALELISKNASDKEGKIAAKLQKKMKKLEKVTSTGAMRVLDFGIVGDAKDDARDGNYVPSANNSTSSETNDSSNNTSTGGNNSSDGSVNASRKRPTSSPNATLSKKRSKDSPKNPIQIPAADEARILQILNDGTLVQILDLWGIGAKKASIIMSRRTTTPLQSLDDLRECGFGPQQLESFAKRNTTATVS